MSVPSYQTITQSRKAAVGINDFTLAMAKQLAAGESDPHANLLFSGYSAALALGMLVPGAKGKTAEEFATLLNLPANAAEGLANYKALNETVRSAESKEIIIAVANALWESNRVALDPAYAATMRKTFGATIENVNFCAPDTVGKVNQWASDNTNKMIDNVVDYIDPATVLMLANAVYFKGLWQFPFDPANTQKDNFTQPGGQKIPVDMMRQGDLETDYLQTSDYQALRLPYGNGDMMMTIVLPNQGRSATEILAASSAESGWLNQYGFSNGIGQIQMPKLDVSADMDLTGPLQTLGLVQAFNEAKADLTGICADGQRSHISFVKQKTVLKSDEVGSEAAAVTTIGLESLGFKPEPTPFDIKLDRPFLLSIQNRQSNAMLFLGVVNTPA